jgi:hypothetical protein
MAQPGRKGTGDSTSPIQEGSESAALFRTSGIKKGTKLRRKGFRPIIPEGFWLSEALLHEHDVVNGGGTLRCQERGEGGGTRGEWAL